LWWFFFFFWDRVSWTICPDWLQTTILLISVSWVARITDVQPLMPGWCLYLVACFVVVFSWDIWQCLETCFVTTAKGVLLATWWDTAEHTTVTRS
jgi:hypothetical protein